jgi:sugar/nucleoside kinase (ribokinase family)
MRTPASAEPGHDALWVLGNFTIDDVVLPDGTTSTGQLGGNAVYGALGAAIWRPRVGMAARIGPDLPEPHVRRLAHAGLALHLVPVPVPSIHNWVRYETGDVRRMGIWADSGSHADQSIRPDELPLVPWRVDACHVAPMPPWIQADLVRSLRHAGVRLVSLDPHDDHVVGHEAELLGLLALVDAFLPSRKEARQLFGRDDPDAAARAFTAAGPRAVVIKLGPEGSLVCGPDGIVRHVPAAPARVVDPTGAGDAYCGGFLAAYAGRPDALAAACHGAVSASFAVERRGALDLVDVDRLEARRRLAALPAAVSPEGDPVPGAPTGEPASPPPPSTPAAPGQPGQEMPHAHG